jgi:ATP-dependent DNA ligase
LEGCILADEVLIDGELAVLQDGRVTTASFALRKELESSLKRVFFAFDLLFVGEECFMEYPLMTRKQHLNLLTQDSEYFFLVPTHCVDNRDDLLAYYQKCIQNFEGIVLKSLKGYVPNSRFHWLKLKPLHTLDLKVIKKEVTKDEKMFLYSLEGEGVELNRIISKIDAPIGCLVEVGYESCGERLKFPKILRRIEHGEK